jgi:hypothetical protein
LAFTTYPHLPPRLKKESSYTSTLPLGRRCVFKGEVYVYLTRDACNMLRTSYPRFNHHYLWTSVQIIKLRCAVPAVCKKLKSSVFSPLRVHQCLASAQNLLQLSRETFAKKLKFPFSRNLSRTSFAGVRKCFYSGPGGVIWKWLWPGEPHEKSCANQM